MATDSSHKVIMGKMLWPLVPSFLIGSSYNKDNHNIFNEFEIQPDPITDCGQLAALECLEKF